MKNIVSLPTIQWIQRLAMIVTLSCCAYVAFFILIKSKENPIVSSPHVTNSRNAVSLNTPAPVFNLKPYAPSSNDRDIFSLVSNVGSPDGTVAATPKGQLPDRLKVVGILISKQSQIIIEDSLLHQTYFIEEGKPQSGISIVKVSPDQMIINYQGQNISVPVQKGL